MLLMEERVIVRSAIEAVGEPAETRPVQQESAVVCVQRKPTGPGADRGIEHRRPLVGRIARKVRLKVGEAQRAAVAAVAVDR